MKDVFSDHFDDACEKAAQKNSAKDETEYRTGSKEAGHRHSMIDSREFNGQNVNDGRRPPHQDRKSVV